MITVLRLGHRAGRDPRISTHTALVARAFGAERLLYSGERDSDMEASVRDISKRWGGSFSISHEKDWRRFIKGFSGKKVHLTMYGIPLSGKITEIRKAGDLLVIIGGEKVPAEVYGMSDYNVSVTGQPHSEVAALAVFLHEFFRGRELFLEFPGAEIAVEPQERGKKTVKPGKHTNFV
jgi:tRNA (cytidine56-2'-O)-methyltransferase